MVGKKRKTTPSLDPDCAFDLSQDPDRRLSWTTASGALPTLRYSGSLLWMPLLRRWLLAGELAAASGFPVADDLAATAQVPLDSTTAAEATNRDLGNGTHVAQLGAVLAVALACAKRI